MRSKNIYSGTYDENNYLNERKHMFFVKIFEEKEF